MYGLELHGVVWDSDNRHELDHDTVLIHRGRQAVVVAEPPVASALADVVCGLAAPVHGEIRVDDRNVTGGPPAPDRIALVPVGAGLLPHRSVARNIEFNLDRANPPDARAAQLADLARRLQVEGVLTLPPHRLSAEQRLRVAVARALGRRPVALVIEDRAGEVPCGRVARAAAAQNVAVLIITESAARAKAFSAPVHTAHPVRTPDTTQEATDDAAGRGTR